MVQTTLASKPSALMTVDSTPASRNCFRKMPASGSNNAEKRASGCGSMRGDLVDLRREVVVAEVERQVLAPPCRRPFEHLGELRRGDVEVRDVAATRT